MNQIIEEIHYELDALIEVIKAFEQYEYPGHRILGPQSHSSSSSTADLKSSQQQDAQMRNGSPAAEKKRQQSGPRSADPELDRPSISLLSPKTALSGTLNQELLSMFSASSISPASGRLRLPKKDTRVKLGQGNMPYQVRYVKVHLIACYTTAEETYRGKVTFMTYTVDNRHRSEDRAMDQQQQSDEEANDDEESPDFKPKVTHTKGKVHILYDDLKAKKLEQVKESLADYGLRIKCRLEQKYNFNLYDWRSDTHSIDLADRSQAERTAYEKILMYKKTVNPGFDETDSWESDGNFLSELIN